MRACLAAASLLLLAGPVTAASNPPPISPSEASGNVGACMTVEGRATLSPSQGRLGTDINLGDGNGFVVYVANEGSLPDLHSLDGQTVDVTGVVLMDRGRPAIQLSNPEKIMVAGTDPGKLMTCDND
jgi:DNA/RNA endonuclease YhcR with UshA esterase domain